MELISAAQIFVPNITGQSTGEVLALRKIYKIGDNLFAYIYEENCNISIPYRSVTNSVEKLLEESRLDLLARIGKNFYSSRWVMFTGYIEGHPYADMGYSRVVVSTNSNDFIYVGNTIEDVWKYLVMMKLKHGT